ncbi:acid ceramidase [Acrasis kona]|uniref:ceramidase n=1 Tax=Acrasis kona TaxID=1008807 RepID=A0AAW2YWM8_9EUKA
MSNTTYLDPPVYNVDLDLPPRQRWKHIALLYRDQMKPLVEYLNDQRKLELGIFDTYATGLLSFVNRALLLTSEHKEELLGFADISSSVGMDFKNLLSFNLGYDFLAYCTSITTRLGSKEKIPHHLRNMDWDKVIADCLCSLTITVNFQRNQTTIYKATTWVGMIGILTAMSSKLSLSLNYRHTTEYFGLTKNVLAMFLGWWPIGLLIRHVLDQNLTFHDTVQQLSNKYIMSPCYLTLTGASAFEGTLITRSRTGSINPLCLSTREYIVQTNMDHWVHVTDPLWAGDDSLLLNALERRTQAEGDLNNYDGHEDYMSFGLNLLSRYPVMNGETVYQVLMNPSKNIYISRVVINPPTKRPDLRHSDLEHLNKGHYQPDSDDRYYLHDHAH